jgi:uncharacterized protein YcaQ
MLPPFDEPQHHDGRGSRLFYLRVMIRTLEELQSFTVARTFFPATTFNAAFDSLGFVQADPIRAPARAQDLILRHRVSGYRVGDLSRSYASANLEEGVLYAYGYLRRPDWELLRPLRAFRLARLERVVLDFLRTRSDASPRDVDLHIGGVRAINDWGRQSTAAAVALARLQHRGLLRVASRDNGLKRYALAPPQARDLLAPAEHYRQLVLLVTRVLSPIPERTLRQVIARFRRVVPAARKPMNVVSDMYRSGELVRQTVGALDYVWPSGETFTPQEGRVRFLAPFDPLVWDRMRFEHLWGWTYRFEAYTPPAKRVRGYYAMPLLYGDRVIGWANITMSGNIPVVNLGFVSGRRPRGRDFTKALDREVQELATCLASSVP